MRIKTLEFNWKKPEHFLGEAVKVYIKDGGAFNFKVMSAGPDWLDGYDDEGINITIDISDIDYIVGGN